MQSSVNGSEVKKEQRKYENGHSNEAGPSHVDDPMTWTCSSLLDEEDYEDANESNKIQENPESNPTNGDGWIESARKAGRQMWNKLKTKETQVEENEKKKETFQHRLWTAWNNMKYSSMLQSDHMNDYEAEDTISMLGAEYDPEKNQPGQTFDDFFIDYYSRIWLTYRSGFDEFPGTTIRSDCGWGCMLRTSQMMVAQAILVLRHGRNWRWNLRGMNLNEKMPETAWEHYEILRLFEDKPSLEAPLGIHRLLELSGGKASAERWFRPSEALSLLKRAIQTSTSSLTAGLAMVVCSDGTLIVPIVERETRNWTRPLLLFICVRLGAHSVNKVYHRHLQYLLKMPNSLGIGGGKPNHSTYFIGYYDQQLIYLDPHVSHPYIPLEKELEKDHEAKPKHKPFSSFHCRLLSKMHISDIDPSCAIGFLINGKNEFEESMRFLNLNQVIDVELGRGLGSKRTKDPIFTVLYEEPIGGETRHISEQERKQAEDHGFELL
ncbi:unnamed protein product, partial [Mesorhabditis belari]|uniref:Cysteine protease n=1 Tax=Mesorhabditis belari TaxID=2138241 RepID=A0AAF3J4H9_9BILA